MSVCVRREEGKGVIQHRSLREEIRWIIGRGKRAQETKGRLPELRGKRFACLFLLQPERLIGDLFLVMSISMADGLVADGAPEVRHSISFRSCRSLRYLAAAARDKVV